MTVYPTNFDTTVASFPGSLHGNPHSCCGVVLKAKEIKTLTPTGVILTVGTDHLLTFREARLIRDNLTAALQEADRLGYCD